MKIGEQIVFEGAKDETIVHKRTFDPNPAIEDARALRDAHGGNLGENRLAARIPTFLFFEWLKEAGVKPGDPAADDVIARKLQDPDNALFRVWGGRF